MVIATIMSGVTTFAGNVTIGGTLTYEDVVNVDSIGVITARNSVVLKHQASGKFAQLNSNAAGAAVIKSDPNNNAANSSVQFHVDGTEAGRFETDRDFTVGNPSAAIGYGATISSTGNITALYWYIIQWCFTNRYSICRNSDWCWNNSTTFRSRKYFQSNWHYC